MNSTQDLDGFDQEVRRHVYDRVINHGLAGGLDGGARGSGTTTDAVRASYRRLADAHVLVLQGDGEILMANPFSAVPTPFRVEATGRSWWGNCIWDALGIPAMVKQDARIITACGDCNDAMA